MSEIPDPTASAFPTESCDGEDDFDTWADCDYTPRKREPSKCGDCGQDMVLRHVCEPAPSEANPDGYELARDLLEAAECVDYWRGSDNCDDRPPYQQHLRELAERLKSAANRAAADARIEGRLADSGFQERKPLPQAFHCVVDDCDEWFTDHAEMNTHSYWTHLEPDPFNDGPDRPFVTHHRYPGVDDAGDFKWFGITITAPRHEK